MMVGNKVLDKEEDIVGVMEEVLSTDTIRNLEEWVQEELMKVSRVISFKFNGYVCGRQ